MSHTSFRPDRSHPSVERISVSVDTAAPVPVRPGQAVRVLLVEGMSLLRGALAATLAAEGGLEVAAAVASVDEAVPAARAVLPDVTVVNGDPLAGEGSHGARRLAAGAPEGAVLVPAEPGHAAAPGG